MSSSLPSPIDLLQKSFEAFMANAVGYLLAGLALTLVGLLLATGLTVIWLGSAFVLVPLFAATGSEAVGALGLLLAGVVGLAAFVAAITLPAPLYASLMRTFDLDGPGGVQFGAVFSHARHDIGRVVVASLAYGGLAAMGMILCFLPGLLVTFALHFVLPAVALDGMGFVDAARRSWEHVTLRPGWALAVWAIYVLVIGVLTQIPLLGALIAIPLAFDFHVRAYRAAYPA